jgi:hypothetical protein
MEVVGLMAVEGEEGCGVGGLVSILNLVLHLRLRLFVLVGPTGHNNSRLVVKVRVPRGLSQLKLMEVVGMAVEAEEEEGWCGVGDLVFILNLVLNLSLKLFLILSL